MAKSQLVIPDWGISGYAKKVKLHQRLVSEYFRTLYFEVFVFGKTGDFWSRIINENPTLKSLVWERTKTVGSDHDKDKLNFEDGLGRYYAARYTAKHSEFKYDEETMKIIEEKVVSHRTSNPHHLEFYQGRVIRLPYEIPTVDPSHDDSSQIEYLDLIEMAADWIASGEEDGADPETWFRGEFEYGSFRMTYDCAMAMSHLFLVAHPFLEENCKLQRFGNNPTELNYGKQERNVRKVG